MNKERLDFGSHTLQKQSPPSAWTFEMGLTLAHMCIYTRTQITHIYIFTATT